MPHEATPTEFIAYVRLLSDHDWEYEFSDDANVYRRARDQRQRMVEMQKEIDPKHETWNDLAPVRHQVAAQKDPT